MLLFPVCGLLIKDCR